MGLSALIADLQNIDIPVNRVINLRKYYSKYPNAIRVKFKKQPSGVIHSPLYPRIQVMKNDLKDAAEAGLDHSVRWEYYNFNIFCFDVFKTLSVVEHCLTEKYVDSITLEIMPKEILQETSIKPELPKTQPVVVKNLPHGIYRYKVYWPTTSRTMKKIGHHALEAIVAQINADPNSKPINSRLVKQILDMCNQHGGRYFYTNHEDILSIISLINPLFINRIEKFITVEEMNEKNISRDTA